MTQTHTGLKRRIKFNPKAPRMKKAKYIHKVISEDLYNKWLANNPEYKDTTFKEWKAIWKVIMEVMWEHIHTDTDGIRLPFYNGDICIKYVNHYRLPPERSYLTEEDVDVAALNWSTGGKLGKIVWSIDGARKYNKYLNLFGFKAASKQSSRAHKSFNENPEIFKDKALSGINAYGVDMIPNAKTRKKRKTE